jgi:hypothetical protein
MKKSCSPPQAVNRYCELAVSATVSQMFRKLYGANYGCRHAATLYVEPRITARKRVVQITLFFWVFRF